jgi:hypothetical protein
VHILAASPAIRKELVEHLHICRIETRSYEESWEPVVAEHFPSLPGTSFT